MRGTPLRFDVASYVRGSPGFTGVVAHKTLPPYGVILPYMEIEMGIRATEWRMGTWRIGTTEWPLRAELCAGQVLNRVATLREFACHSSHKAGLDFQHGAKVLKLRYNYFISIRHDRSSTAEL